MIGSRVRLGLALVLSASMGASGALRCSAMPIRSSCTPAASRRRRARSRGGRYESSRVTPNATLMRSG